MVFKLTSVLAKEVQAV